MRYQRKSELALEEELQKKLSGEGDSVPAVTELSDKEEKRMKALEYLAAGYSVYATAKKIGMPQTTLYKWTASDAAFQASLESATEMFILQAEQGLIFMIKKAQDIVNEALMEERDAKSDVVLLAERLLARTSHRAINIKAGVPTADEPGGKNY